MIRILHVVTQMGHGGLESRLMDIYRNIDRSRFQFDFYTNRMEEGSFDAEIKSMGGIMYYCQPISILTISKKESEFVSFLQGHVEYKIVHSHVNEWSTVFCKAAKVAGVPVRIAHSRGANTDRSAKRIIKDMIKLSLKRYATHFFAVSAIAGKHLFGEKAYRQNRVQIWPNAVDCQKFRYDPIIRARMRKELNCEDKLVVAHVGNLLPVKNHIFLLEVFEKIKASRSDAYLILAGEGSEIEHIKSWIAGHGLIDDVLLLGSYPRVSQLLQAADLFVFPSLHEGFPGAVLEAEAAGLPCLTSDAITPEVCLTPGCVQMPLATSAFEWATAAIALAESPRTDTYQLLCERGYDVITVAKRYEAFYSDRLCDLQA